MSSGKYNMGIVFLGIGVSALFAFGMCLDASEVAGERCESAVEMGEQVL